MLAPCIFKQINGMQIALDAHDVCTVTETPEGYIQIMFLATNDPDIILTGEGFEEVVSKLHDACRKYMIGEPHEGDEWKSGGDDDEGCY